MVNERKKQFGRYRRMHSATMSEEGGGSVEGKDGHGNGSKGRNEQYDESRRREET